MYGAKKKHFEEFDSVSKNHIYLKTRLSKIFMRAENIKMVTIVIGNIMRLCPL